MSLPIPLPVSSSFSVLVSLELRSTLQFYIKVFSVELTLLLPVTAKATSQGLHGIHIALVLASPNPNPASPVLELKVCATTAHLILPATWHLLPGFGFAWYMTDIAGPCPFYGSRIGLEEVHFYWVCL